METPTPISADKPSPKNVNPFLKVIFLVVAAVVMPLWESAKYLCRKAYDDSGLSAAIGVLAGLGAGIGVGYFTSHSWDWSVMWWLGSGVLSAIVTFVYAWPAFYLGVMKQAFRASEKLWNNVDRDRHNYGWVSHVLMFLSYAATILGAIYLAWYTMNVVHGSLTWGFFGWIVGAVAGFFAGGIGGALVWNAVRFGRMPLLAVITGVGTAYTLGALNASLLAHYGLPAYLGWVAYVVEFFLYVAYVFPLAHVILTHGFGWLADLVEELDKNVYDESRTGYRQFSLHVVNIAGTYQLTKVSFLLWAYLGFTNHWLTLGLAALTAVVSYTLLGKLLQEAGNRLVGVVTGLHAAFFAGLAYYNLAWFGGIYGAAVCAAVAMALTYFVAFPIAYVVVRFIARPLLASWLTTPLVWVHDNICKAFSNLGRELVHAADNTYDDATPYRRFFLHVLNLGTMVAAFLGSSMLMKSLGFPLWLSIPGIALGVVLSYLLIGKLLLKVGNGLPGTLVSLAAGIYAGTIAYGAQSHGLWVAIPVGLVSAALTFGLIFPVLYITVRAIVNLVRPEVWAEPTLTRVHDAGWRLVSNLWAEFLSTYRSLKVWFTPTWQNLKATWASAWQSVRDTWESVTNKSK